MKNLEIQKCVQHGKINGRSKVPSKVKFELTYTQLEESYGKWLQRNSSPLQSIGIFSENFSSFRINLQTYSWFAPLTV